MKILRLETQLEELPLTRPYTIATRTIAGVSLFFVRLISDAGAIGLGSASPSPGVTGETVEACREALGRAEDLLVGRDPRHLGALCRQLQTHLDAAPAARAAVDMALYDLFTRHLDIPLVDFFGRCHRRLPTSITLGIRSTEEALDEASEYLGRGFRSLKVKIGLDLESDLERLHKLRQAVGPDIDLRVDANLGYTSRQLTRLVRETAALDLELIEQPLAKTAIDEMRRQPAEVRRLLAADESLLDERDALRLVEEPPACGIFNIKLMKCGGPTSARNLAMIAETRGCELMWGCMDESVISISAALHTAYSSPATRYLDLDGSFDLARDLASGGFTVADGHLVLSEGPGLGAQLDD